MANYYPGILFDNQAFDNSQTEISSSVYTPTKTSGAGVMGSTIWLTSDVAGTLKIYIVDPNGTARQVGANVSTTANDPINYVNRSFFARNIKIKWTPAATAGHITAWVDSY